MLWYLATPYRAFAGDFDEACEAACEQAAHLMDAGVLVFSPVSHTHGIARQMPVQNHTDNDFWMRQDLAVLDRCDGLIVCKLSNWDKSEGVRQEIEHAANRRIPIVYMEPGEVDEALVELKRQS